MYFSLSTTDLHWLIDWTRCTVWPIPAQLFSLSPSKQQIQVKSSAWLAVVLSSQYSMPMTFMMAPQKWVLSCRDNISFLFSILPWAQCIDRSPQSNCISSYWKYLLPIPHTIHTWWQSSTGIRACNYIAIGSSGIVGWMNEVQSLRSSARPFSCTRGDTHIQTLW